MRMFSAYAWLSPRAGTTGFTINALVLLVSLFSQPSSAGNTPLVAAASSLQFALTEISSNFSNETGHRVKLVFGSSGNFARQISQGAPYELFMAADETYVESLAADGLTRDEGVVYAMGRIALAIPPGSTLKADASLADLKTAISDDRLTHFAIANPEHAPYGVRARQALTHKGLWDAIQPSLVLGENASQATQFAISPNTQGGIIAYSLALSPSLADKAEYLLLPDDYHQPLRQRMVLLNNSGETAELFYQFVQQPGSIAILRKYGFD